MEPSATGPASLSGHIALGRWGEARAAEHLVGLGFSVLERNFRCCEGEVDILLRDGDVLVACEVKTRSSALGGTPHEAVDARRVGRLRRAALVWVAGHTARPRDIRVDLVAVLRPRGGQVQIEHVRGIG